jgi:hypothetical protein
MCLSTADFVFLDLAISLDCPTLRVEYAQTKQVIPLCASSAHSPSVHKSWPGAVCSRASRLSDSPSSALKVLSDRYREANAHPETLQRIMMGCVRSLVVPRPVHSREASVVFVLRYHPVFRRAFYRALSLVPFPEYYGLQIMPAWRNALPSVGGSIESANNILCKRAYGKEGALCVSLANTSLEQLHSFLSSNLLKRVA